MEWVAVSLTPNQKVLYEYLEAEWLRQLKKSRITAADLRKTIIREDEIDIEKILEGLGKVDFDSFGEPVMNQPAAVDKTIENPLSKDRLARGTLLREVCADVSMLRNYITKVDARRDEEAEKKKRDPFFITLRKFVQQTEWKNPKLNELLEILDSYKEDHKIIVFTQFAQIVKVISNALRKKTLHVTVTGKDMNAEERNRAVQRFLSDDKVRVLVTTDTMQYGMNLQSACDVVVNYDLPWNPARLYQRIGRVHRIGQSAHKVVAINLLVQDTVEEHVKHIVEKKAGLFKLVTGTNLMPGLRKRVRRVPEIRKKNRGRRRR
jgi:SNF2 family DNA or RNA helicase